MTKKNETTVKTLAEILAAANEKVDNLNKTEDQELAKTLESEVEGLVQDYNDLSLLTVYCDCKSHELPIMELAKTCTYHKISKTSKAGYEVRDGVVKKVYTYSINESNANLNVLKFIKWLKDRNFKMPADWTMHMSAVKANIIDQWKAFDADEEGYKFHINELKRLLQIMVDDMGFIAGEKGANALKVKSAHVRTILKFANKQTGVQTGETLTSKIWDDLLLSVLNSVAANKAFENVYGGSEIYKDETSSESEAETKTDSTTQNK